MTLKYLYSIIAGLAFGIFLLSSLSSCRKELPRMEDPSVIIGDNLPETFEIYWKGMNDNYIFWDQDPTNWAEVYRKYKPLFANLKSSNKEDIRKAYSYFKQMSSTLIDSHLTLSFQDMGGALTDSAASYTPAEARYYRRPEAHEPILESFFLDTVAEKYLTNVKIKEGGFFDPVSIVVGQTPDNILYIYISSFELSDLEEEHMAPTGVFGYFLNEVKSNPNLRGLIIDVRGNGGGYLSDLNLLMGPLVDKPFVFASTRTKMGSNRLEYSPWADAQVAPKGTKAFSKPIVALVDGHSVSMAEVTAMAVKALPNGNGKVVGERTWGAHGPLGPNYYHNSGQFSIGSNLITSSYTSSIALRYKNGIMYEGVGFPPDVEVLYNDQQRKLGNDIQLEEAIRIINR